MANLSTDAVTTLVSEIGKLKKELEGTLIDQAEISKRYDATTNGILTASGSLDTAKWEALPPAQRAVLEDQLSKLRQELSDLRDVYAHEDGPSDKGSLMYKEFASNSAIRWLTIIAFVGLFADLGLICHEWEAATAGTRGILEFCKPSYSADLAKADATGVTMTPSPISKDSAKLTSSPTSETAQAASSDTPNALEAVASTTPPSLRRPNRLHPAQLPLRVPASRTKRRGPEKSPNRRSSGWSSCWEVLAASSTWRVQWARM
jgi:hypothetical protein